MADLLRLGLVGVKGGGVQKHHIDSCAILDKEGLGRLVAVAETKVKDNAALAMLRDQGKAWYTDYQRMLADEDLDVILITAPHHWHVPMSLYAFGEKTHVFCEKPPAVTIQDGDLLVKKRDEAGLKFGVNYMYVAAESTQKLLQTLAQGKIGEIKRIIGRGTWVRTNEYYNEVEWRGKKMIGDTPLLDGCLFNQFPHLLMQCIAFSGFAQPKTVTAELYRAHSTRYIEMEDTACLKVTTTGPEIYLYATVCHTKDTPISVEIVGTEGSAYWEEGKFFIQYNDGRKTEPDICGYNWGIACLEMLRNHLQVVREGAEPLLTLEQALMPTLIINGAHVSSGGIVQIDKKYITEVKEQPKDATTGREAKEPETQVRINDIRDQILDASGQRYMFSEMGYQWGRPSLREVDLTTLKTFDIKLVR